MHHGDPAMQSCNAERTAVDCTPGLSYCNSEIKGDEETKEEIATSIMMRRWITA
jgi:hypothetical protein